MKKLFFIFFSFSLFLALPLSAQNYLKAGRSAVKAGVSAPAAKSGGSFTKFMGNIRSKAAQVFHSVKPKAKLPANSQATGTAKGFRQSAKQPKPDLHIAALERAAKNPKRLSLSRPLSPMRNFQAMMPDNPGTRFSGTVFSVEYNGEKEIYGVVASHILAANDGTGYNVKKTFSAVFDNKGEPLSIPAEIITVSAPSHLDLSLVKFPAEYEKVLNPYSIGKIESEKSVQTCGFNHGGAVHMTSCAIQNNRPYSIHINIPLPREERPGLCGSAVLNAEQELVGIIVGSTLAPWAEQDRTFVAPAAFLNQLVEAYHNNGQSSVSFLLQGTHSIRLNVNEYVTRVVLLDNARQPLYRYNVKERFSRTEMNEALKSFPQTRYLEVVTQTINWSEDGSTLLKKKDRNFPPVAYTYDLQSNQIISTREVKTVLPF